jgi:integrase
LSARIVGTYVEPSRMTLRDYLVERWLPAAETTVRPTTAFGYRQHVERYLVPRLGGVPLQGLTPDRITVMYRDLLEAGGRDGRPLAANTVRRVHATLHRALRDAVAWGYTARNPAAAAAKPRVPSAGEHLQVWSSDEAQDFLRAVQGDRLYAAWHLALSTGMRRGELLGLHWRDVDLGLGRAAVRHTITSLGQQVVFGEPKTRRSRRSVALDAGSVAVLRRWRAQQAQERLAAGAGWQDTGLVFTREDGRHVHPDRFCVWFGKHVRRAGLRQIRFHDLRHTHASLALQAGVSAKVVSDRLGHSSVAFTLDVYSHVVPALQEAAAESVAALFGDMRGTGL